MRLVAISHPENVKGIALSPPPVERFSVPMGRIKARIHLVGPIASSDLDWWGGISASSLAEAVLSEADQGHDIEIVFDSPGGGLTGLDEVCKAIHQAQTKVQVSGYARGMCCSAAYWIASQCHPLTASPLAVMGSIGVQLAERKDTSEGCGIVVFRSSGANLKNADPAQNPEQYQALVDDAEREFIKAITEGRGRGYGPDELGNGAIFGAREALTRGLIDAISEEEVSMAKNKGLTAETAPTEEEKAPPVEEAPAEEKAPVEEPAKEEPKDEVADLKKELEDLRKQLADLVKEKTAAEAKAHAERRSAAVEALLVAHKITPGEKAAYEALYDRDQALFGTITGAKQPVYEASRKSSPFAGTAVTDAASLTAQAREVAKANNIKGLDALRKIVGE